VSVHRLNEKDDYVTIIRPDGVGMTTKGKEEKEEIKELLRSIR
jgi:Mn-dependent DtxR family transcriptional regulator